MTTAQTAYVIFPDGTRITAEVADTDAARARGLMFRDALAEDRGMLFPFAAAGRHPFWMKHVRFALDIVWLDAAGRVVWIVESAPPCAAEPCPMYVPGAKGSMVLELAGGVARRHGLAAGDIVRVGRPGEAGDGRP